MKTTVLTQIRTMMDETAAIHPWPGEAQLPLFLAEKYTFYELTLLDSSSLLLEALQANPTVREMENDLFHLQERIEKPAAFLLSSISPYMRKNLVQHRIPFMVENGQMYLPFLGLEFNRQSKKPMMRKEHLSSMAQMLYLYWLYHPDWVINATQLAEMLDITQMHAGRLLSELSSYKLLTYDIGGATSRAKNYTRLPDPEYYRRGREYLLSPVSRIVHANLPPGLYRYAGLDALSRLSMLNPPDQPILAISRQQEKLLAMDLVTESDIIQGQNLPAVQIWKYDPAFLCAAEHVDVLSLALSLQPVRDERVEQALEGVLKKQPWYTD